MLIGNLTRDPEIKYTPKGQALAELGLAINRYYSIESTGEKREETTFVDVTLWGRQAEIAKEYLHKGRPVYIEGRLQLDTWEDKQTGQKRSKMRVVGETMQLLGSREGGGSAGGARSNSRSASGNSDTFSSPFGNNQDDFGQSFHSGGSSTNNPGKSHAQSEVEEDDIPF